VIHTLVEAIILVALVVIVFLQTWRASVIPLLAVPVSVVGTFAVMLGFGFSINTLSLFGLVLAIGIVVDDAIVVVENVERNIDGLSPREATIQAMKEVSGPIIAIALVLCAVFVPIAFVSGLSGQFYKQFALTIAISTVISAFSSLTLAPALSAVLLRPPMHRKTADPRHGQSLRRLLRLVQPLLQPCLAQLRNRRDRRAEAQRRSLVVYAVLAVAAGFMFKVVPPGFVPAQDKQYLIGFAQLPDAASLDRTDAVIRKMSDIAKEFPAWRFGSPACRSTASPTRRTRASCSRPETVRGAHQA
jgi:multidrug efflux pump